MMRRSLAALGVAGLLAVAVAAPALAADPPFQVVADGLHSPRGLAFGPGGRLYVAEAGLGSGTAATGVLPGFGHTGSITEIRGAWGAHPTARSIVTGLPSAAESEPGMPPSAVGIDGISVHGNGGIYGILALSQDGTGLPSPMGELIKVTPSGHWRSVANVGDFEYAWTGDHASLSPRDFPDSNPYGVLAVAGRQFVVDAGANTLAEVTANGRIRNLAFFPDNALADSTPTCVTKGPDGALYVGTLALVDSIVHGPSAKVYRVDLSEATGSESSVLSVATVWADHLFPITGCTFGRDGTFYASQFFTAMGQQGPTAGDVVAIPFSDPGQHTMLTGGALAFPGGVAYGPDGHVYVANGSIFANGAVVRLP